MYFWRPTHAASCANLAVAKKNCKFQKAVRELTALNTSATSQKNLPQPSGCRSKFLKHEEVLRRARSLQYSRAMNLLRSPGLATEPGATIHEALRELHPQEDLITDDFATPREVPIPRRDDLRFYRWICGSMGLGQQGNVVPFQI